MKKLIMIFFARKSALLPAILLYATIGVAQKTIHTEDIDNFWLAYDSVHTTTDTAKQAGYIQRLYLDKASAGLKEFMSSRNHSAQRHLKNILSYPKYWKSVRPFTLKIKKQEKEINEVMKRFAKLYPYFKKPEVYFMIGVLNSGGTTGPGKILIGAEMAAADSTVDASELSDWHRQMFRYNRGIVEMVAHEAVHTQQKESKDPDYSLLSQSIMEGSCDFIAELILKRKINSPYMVYGFAHEKEIWDEFKKEMYSEEIDRWLYNAENTDGRPADLGYFVGYAITRAYYEKVKEKKNAIKEIIDLDFTKEAVELFLRNSSYLD